MRSLLLRLLRNTLYCVGVLMVFANLHSAAQTLPDSSVPTFNMQPANTQSFGDYWTVGTVVNDGATIVVGDTSPGSIIGQSSDLLYTKRSFRGDVSLSFYGCIGNQTSGYQWVALALMNQATQDAAETTHTATFAYELMFDVGFDKPATLVVVRGYNEGAGPYETHDIPLNLTPAPQGGQICANYRIARQGSVVKAWVNDNLVYSGAALSNPNNYPSGLEARSWDSPIRLSNIELGQLTFLPTGSLSIGRLGHTATKLPNGKVLVAGGDASLNSGPFLDTAEVYDPSSGTFSLVGNMTSRRSGHTATLLKTGPNAGKVLIVGGMTFWGSAGSNFLSTAEIYDPATQQFRAVVANLATRRTSHTATLLQDGKVLIAGGWWSDVPGLSYYLDTAEIFDPDTETFSQFVRNSSPLEIRKMASPRIWFGSFLLPNGKVLVAGGSQADSATLAATELYNPVTDRFEPGVSMISSRLSHYGGAALADGRVLFAGGQTFSGGDHIFSDSEVLSANGLSTAAASPLGVPRTGGPAVTLNDGRVLVVGGFNGQFLDTAELYNAGANAFVLLPAKMTRQRYVPTATKLDDGNVLIVGGYAPTAAIATAEIYRVDALPLVDSTPPVITYTIDGVSSAPGWYSSAITVTWFVTDSESPITSAPCAPVTLTTATIGTVLTCSATSAGGTATQSATINIDLTPPVVTPTITGQTGANGWYTGQVTVSWSAVDPESPITSSPCPSTTLVADSQGVAVTCSATSAGGVTTEAVTIKIDSSPVTMSCSVSPSVIWPPNDRLVSVVATVTASASISGQPTIVLSSVSSSEPNSGYGSPDVAGWMLGTLDLAGELRATRAAAGPGRTYTLVYKATDPAGNASNCAVTVTVPHDKGR